MVDGCAPGKGLGGANGFPDGGRSPLSRPGAKAPPSYLGYLSCQPEGSGTLDSPGGQPKAAPRASPCELKRSGAPTGRRNRRGLCLRSEESERTLPPLRSGGGNSTRPSATSDTSPFTHRMVRRAFFLPTNCAEDPKKSPGFGERNPGQRWEEKRKDEFRSRQSTSTVVGCESKAV